MLSSFPVNSPLRLFTDLKTIGDWHKQRVSRQINDLMYRVECNRSGVDLLESLQLDVLILEPTGGWYSGFWHDNATKLGIQVCWVSHAQVKHSRNHYKFKNKDDRSDAFTIALLYFDAGSRDELGNPPFLKKYDHDAIEKLRSLVYEREQIDKNANTLINQLRMRLTREFPEIARRDLERIGAKGVNPTLGHLTERVKNRQFPKTTAGTGIARYSVFLAEDILRLKDRLLETESMMHEIATSPEFSPYYRIFTDFGYGFGTLGLMMIHCYPFDRFLVDGRPYRKSGHDLTLFCHSGQDKIDRKLETFSRWWMSHELT